MLKNDTADDEGDTTSLVRSASVAASPSAGASSSSPARVKMLSVQIETIQSNVARSRRKKRRCAAAVCASSSLMLLLTLAIAGRKSGDDGSYFSNVKFKDLPPPEKTLTSLLFGSCAKQTYPQAFWDTAASLNPDMFIFGGDNVYGDLDPTEGYQDSGCADETCQVLRQAYNDLQNKPSFQGFASRFPILPIWDDHDFGINDGGASFPYKAQSQQLFLDFWKAFPNRRALRKRKGLYSAFVHGENERRIQIILLDCRYFKSEWKPRVKNRTYATAGDYLPSTEAGKTLLGDDQWKWLNTALAVDDIDLRIVVSSIQVLSEGHGFEAWGLFPNEQTRLVNMLTTANAPRTIILSGDRHIGAMYRKGELNEITASSLTHSFTGNMTGEVGKPNLIPDTIVQENNIAKIDVSWDTRTVTFGLVRADGHFAGNLLTPSVLSLPF